MKAKERGSLGDSPSIEVVPRKALVDETVGIRLIGFSPSQIVTVKAQMIDEAGKRWESHATFKADAQGIVDVNSQKPLSGTYSKVDPTGLFWSMVVAPDEKEISSFATRTLTPPVVTFSAEANGKEVASARLERSFIAPSIVRKPVREDGLVGVFFRSKDAVSQPGVILLGGSGGGVSEQFAALLASHGYSVLALAYFAMEGLPAELREIPLEYFQKAIRWMQSQKTVIAEKLAAMGWSRGGELVLLLGATFPEIRAVVAFVPSGVIWGGVTRNRDVRSSWTHLGKPLPFVSNMSSGSDRADYEMMVSASMPVRLTPYFLRALEDAAAVKRATIPVERINGPILLISGEDDQMWPSSFFSKLIMERLLKHKHRHAFRHLSYKGAGHMIKPDFMPKTFTVTRHSVTKNLYELGGNAKDNAFASADSWFKAIEFLDSSLKGKSGKSAR